jgi:hypothetical protein
VTRIVECNNSCCRLTWVEMNKVIILLHGTYGNYFFVLNEHREPSSLHDQDYIHNGKKMINPLNSHVWLLQLGVNICCLEHLGLM